MRWSKALIPTLRDNPADADSAADRLLVRAGFMRRIMPGVCALLPLGQRTMLKVAAIVRQQMVAAGAQEFRIPERDSFGAIARNEVRSYKDLPQLWYAIQEQSVDEHDARSGLLRLRQFTTVSCCPLDLEAAGVDRSCRLLRDICSNICNRCGLEAVTVEARGSIRIMVRMAAGAATLVACTCGYIADPQSATSHLAAIVDPNEDFRVQQVHTPGQKTIADVSRFLDAPASRQIKTLVYVAGDRALVFLVRGDHQLNEDKAKTAADAGELRPALMEEIRAVFGADAGSLGPVGLEGVPVFADRELQGRRNMICGANRDDYHLTGVTPGVDFQPAWSDLRMVERGESCVRCGRVLETCQATEVARIGRPTGPQGADPQVLAADGRQIPVLMGSAEIGLEQILACCVELHHDDDGIIWPSAIAPFSVIITPVTQKGEVAEAGERVYSELAGAGLDALLDDRRERPGVKFKDADLIGIPYRVVIGGEKLKQGKVELFDRARKSAALVDLDALTATLTDLS